MNDNLNEILLIINSSETKEEKKKQLLSYHASDIAEVFSELNKDKQLEIAKILGKEEFSDILSFLDNKDEFLDMLDEDVAADVIELMDADDAVDVLEEIDEEDRSKIIELLDEDIKKDVKLILSYSKEQVGSLMTTNYISIPSTSTVKSAMKDVISQAKENDNITSIVVLENNAFYGIIDLKDLIILRAEDDINSKIVTNYPTIYADALIDDCINDLKKYNEDLIPVIDHDNKVLGVITSSDIVELVQSEAEEDYNRLAGLLKQEDEEESVFGSIKKRIPWLILLLVLGLLVSSVISVFSDVISGVTAAVLFQSVVFDMAGNGGTQSLAVTLTKITKLDDIKHKTFKQMLGKELLVGFLNGLILGSISFGVVLLFLVLRGEPITVGNIYNIQDALKVSGSVGVAILISMSISSILGLVLPVIFKKVKVDPAVASGPMITTINDICSSCIYYTLVGILFSLLF